MKKEAMEAEFTKNEVMKKMEEEKILKRVPFNLENKVYLVLLQLKV